MEAYILIAGLVLFSATTTFNLHKQAVDAQKVNNPAATEQHVEKGFFEQDKRK